MEPPKLGESWFGALMTGSLGLLAAFALKPTGNIWFPIGMQPARDWGQKSFLSTPDRSFRPSHPIRLPKESFSHKAS
jgi:hypothetical protein